MARVLGENGYLVLPPSERRAAVEHRGSEVLRDRLLMAFYRRHQLGVVQDPENPSLHGLTDREASRLLGHEDAHRRCAELRKHGLLTNTPGGSTHIRQDDSGRGGAVSVITPAGIALARMIEASRRPHD